MKCRIYSSCKFHSFIQVGLKSGGVNRFINEETDDEADLLPEHQDQLKHVRYDTNKFVCVTILKDCTQ